MSWGADAAGHAVPGGPPAPGRALVIGYALSGGAAARWLSQRGWDVTVVDDAPQAVPGDEQGVKAGETVLRAPGPFASAELARRADLVVPSPGVPVSHPALTAAEAAAVPVASEVELGWWQVASARAGAGGTGPVLVAITGTNGKTTVTRLVTAMLDRSGLRAVAAGNVGVPLLEAASAAGAGTVLVTEVSSFQLHYTSTFRPDVSCWLNFSPDHLDWHPDLAHYAKAKARIWANQGPGCTAVVNAGDEVVNAAAAEVPPGTTVVRFGPGASADWGVLADRVVGPDGFSISASELPRSLPHDLANTAAALAVALASGASPEASRAAARATPAPPHRVQLVASVAGVDWYDDSKATTPASVQAAVRGFASVVLIAGGRNKGLDLSVLAATVPPVRSVVAIGESAAEVAAAFAGAAPVVRATSMGEAVRAAAGMARPGDAVVLSPGCASFDWYSSYAARGEDFADLVTKMVQEVAAR